MDRRDALKKLAAGTATVATASVVVSSPAFAYTAPTPPANPTISAALSGFLSAELTVTLSPGLPTCPASAIHGASAPNTAYSTSVTGPVSVTQVSPSVGPPLVVRFTRTGFGTAAATITYRVRYRCSYQGQNADVCKSWAITYGPVGIFTAWPTTPTSISVGTACP